MVILRLFDARVVRCSRAASPFQLCFGPLAVSLRDDAGLMGRIDLSGRNAWVGWMEGQISGHLARLGNQD